MTNLNPISNQPASTAQPAAPSVNSRVSTDTFLQLLVAEIKNQNPLEPQKGSEFLSQLATFSTLEQLIAMRADLAALRQAAAASTPNNS